MLGPCREACRAGGELGTLLERARIPEGGRGGHRQKLRPLRRGRENSQIAPGPPRKGLIPPGNKH